MAYPTTLLDAPVSSQDHRRPRRRIPGPLAAILAAQACLSLLLAVSNTAFEDEALYIWAGHVELAQWFHGAHGLVSPFTRYLSGAPQIYPPLAALADSAGGLLGARILSLAFMLGVVPLVLATGAGASAEKSIGIAVLTGMLGSTLLTVSFVPSVFAVMQTFEEWHQARRKAAAAA